MNIPDMPAEREALLDEIRLLKQHRADEERTLRQITEACKVMTIRLQKLEAGKIQV